MTSEQPSKGLSLSIIAAGKGKECLDYTSTAIVKNGSNENGKPKPKFNSCGRQFVLNPQKQKKSGEIKRMIDDLLLEKVP